MKKIFLFLIIIPYIIFALRFSGEYNYNYYYYQSLNAYGENRVILNMNADKGIASFHLQGLGQFYIGGPKYIIPYPDNIPNYVIDNLPSYYQLSNSMKINTAYLSIYYLGFNLKFGKFPMKWGISQTYAPADIFSSTSPMDYSYIEEGILGFLGMYSFGDNTISFIYQDHTDYEQTKQGLLFENINNYFTASLFSAHFFNTRRIFNGFVFRTNTVEYLLSGFNIITDYWGPGIWIEIDYFADVEYWIQDSIADYSHYFLIAGVDYTFNDLLYTSLEYIYYSEGKTDGFTYNDILRRYLNDNFLISKHYLIPIIGINQGETISGEFAAMINANDLSSMIMTSLIYQPREYLSMDLNSSFVIGNLGKDFYGLPPIYTFQLKFYY